MDAALKKSALRLFTYGLYAVTAKHGDEVSAMTVNWISQASFDPPMIMLAVLKARSTGATGWGVTWCWA